MKSCEQYELLASLVLDGEASETEQAELAAHLETCPDCRAYFEDIRRIHGSFAREEITVPEGFAARVMDRVRRTEQEEGKETKEKKVVPFPHWKRWTALAACCAVVAASAWAVRSTGGVKDAMITADAAPQMAMDARSAAGTSAVQEADVYGVYEDAGTEDTAGEPLSEAPPEMPEEYRDMAKSAIKDGEAEGFYQPLVNDAPDSQEPAIAAAPPLSTGDSGEPEAPAPTDTPTETDRQDTPDRDNASPEEDKNASEEPTQDAEAEPPAPVEEPDAAEAPDAPEESDASEELDTTVEPVEIVDDVEPVEVIGVPEPGVLIAFGSAAQGWTENVLGLEWTSGGSYPLSAEQYSDLIRTLDEAGEPYRIEPGEGYCLMAE